MSIFDPFISQAFFVGAMLFVAYFYDRKIKKEATVWKNLIAQQLVRAGWTAEEITDAVEFHTGWSDAGEGLEDHLVIAWEDFIRLSSEQKATNLLRLKRTIEMTAYAKGWEENELGELSSRMLALLDENGAQRQSVMKERGVANLNDFFTR